jgi:uncharacterized RDD family membrane protein YckC
VLEGLFGRALGKLLLGLRIADVNGRAASIARLLARAAVKQSAGLLSLTSLVTGAFVLTQVGSILRYAIVIGFLFVLRAHRRALHDFALGRSLSCGWDK